MVSTHHNLAVLIAGPTASGKSALAMALARAENGVIINADALQVYRDLRGLTARPSSDDEAAVPHRLYGHVAAAEAYSVARWQGEAMAEVRAALAAGRLPIICGGTGLYFMSLLEGLAEVPEIKVEIRERWRGFKGDLHSELSRRDPVSAQRLHPSDRQRLIRALEVIDSTGRSLSDWQARAAQSAPLAGFALRKIYKTAPRDVLYARAEARFDQMLEHGALAEVRALPPVDPQSPIMKAIGLRELLAHLRDEMTLDSVRAQAKTATRNYIKRQLTWARARMADWEMTE